jgi:Poly (ADP-ribose) glycohydrolase (PARG)
MTSVAVHTGYWGCGAFGGNRVLMALLQVLAAGSAGLDQLVFHVGDPADETRSRRRCHGWAGTGQSK